MSMPSFLRQWASPDKSWPARISFFGSLLCSLRRGLTFKSIGSPTLGFLYQCNDTNWRCEMKMLLSRWTLCASLFIVMLCSALTLTSDPAIAGTCTAARCQQLHTTCVQFCAPFGGVKVYACPDPGHPTGADCVCFTNNAFFNC
jgi:hypothetical protein